MTMTSVPKRDGGNTDPMLGHALDGRYEIISKIARGGMATVYQARDLRLQRCVAIKIMHIGLGNDDDFALKFDREARAAARLSHPNIVSVFDQGYDLDRSFIVMEYVPGRTLRNLVGREAPLPALRACELMEPVLAALAAAHEAGLVHRDIKPENVLLSERGQIKVADFGLSKAISSSTSTATAGVLIGTVSYLPPELVTNSRADARSDVYSAGVMLFEMLTGVKPHTGDTPIQVAYAHVHNDVPVPSAVAPRMDIPDFVDALVATSTARDPELRPADGHAFWTMLRRVRQTLQRGVTSDLELVRELSEHLGSAEDTDLDGQVTEVVSVGYTGGKVEHTPIRTIDDVRRALPRPLLTPATPAEPFDADEAPEDFDDEADEPAEPSPREVRATRIHQAQRRRRRRGVVILLFVLLLTGAVSVGSWYAVAGRYTRSPDLTGMTQPQVQEAVSRTGLGVEFDPPQYSETVPFGQVVSADPTAGGRIERGGVVRVVLSRGLERYPVPKLVGLTLTSAKAALATSSLATGTVSSVYSEQVGSGVVIFAGAKEKTKVSRGTPIDLTVSKGRKPIKVDSWVGKSAADARTALTRAGFKVAETRAYSETVTQGMVIGQSPGNGTAFAHDTITITTSLGPPVVLVPNVRAMSEKAATKVMQDKGFKVVAKPVAGINALGLGYVSYTDPVPGSKARKGSTITLYLV